MHPDRMLAGEGVSEMPEIEVGLDGYRVVDHGSLGEMALRSMLTEALPPDLLTQTADGWGADEAVTLVDNGAGEIAWVYPFKGDSATTPSRSPRGSSTMPSGCSASPRWWRPAASSTSVVRTCSSTARTTVWWW